MRRIGLSHSGRCGAIAVSSYGLGRYIRFAKQAARLGGSAVLRGPHASRLQIR